MVDEEVMRKWVREAEARLVLQPLTSHQKGLLAEMGRDRNARGPGVKAPNAVLAGALGRLKMALLKIEGQVSSEPDLEAAVQDALRAIDQTGASLRSALESKQFAMPKPGFHLGRSRISGPNEVAEAEAAKRFREALEELAPERRRYRAVEALDELVRKRRRGP